MHGRSDWRVMTLYDTQKASRHLMTFAMEGANRIIARAEKNTNLHLLSSRHV